MSISNWYFKINDKRILMDAYITRIPEASFTPSALYPDTAQGQLAFFVNNSASAFDLDKDIHVDGVNYGSPLGNLAAAMKDAGITQVDAWIGTGGLAVAEMIIPVLHPKTYIPSHWDGLFSSFWAGMPYPFKDEALQTYLGQQKVAMVRPTQYFDKYVLTSTGVTTQDNHAQKAQLGFSDTQKFSAALLDSVTQVASTSVGDDCGEGFQELSAWSKLLAVLERQPGKLTARQGQLLLRSSFLKRRAAGMSAGIGRALSVGFHDD